MPRILIVDDDPETCSFLETLLKGSDRDVTTTLDPEEAIAAIHREPFDLLISDVQLNAPLSGLDVLRAFKAQRPSAQAVLISGVSQLETAVDAVRAGVFDYVSKPLEVRVVREVVDRALDQAKRRGARQAPGATGPAGLLGRSPPMLEVYKQIACASESSASVLICGESGTGKELAARAIHAHGAHAHDPFVAINCGAIPDTLLESTLFGHARGAFTGAVADAKGLFEQAGGGTVFLDEIGETSLAMQVRLLRVLEEAEVRPVGATRVVRISARVIAATNANVDQAVTAGTFRSDLYYRLGVIIIQMPALRDRTGDIPLLVDSFLERAGARAGRRVTLSSAAVDAMTRYDWPGNIRELRNAIERLVVFSRGSLVDVADLPPVIRDAAPPIQERVFSRLPTLEELEGRYLLHVLKTVGGSRIQAAQVLDVDRRTIYRMVQRLETQAGDSLETPKSAAAG